MKMKKAIIRTLIVMMVAVLGLGSIIPSLAVANESKDLALSYFRYVNGAYTNGYAIQTSGAKDRHPILQMTSQDNEKNFYCLNATNGYSWNSAIDASTTKTAEYKKSYDLDSSEDVGIIRGNTTEPYEASKSIVESQYFKQILWILDNMYVSDPSKSNDENEEKQKAILERAGIVFGDVDDYDLNDNIHQAYKYVAPEGYDYSNKLNDTSRTIPNPQNQGLPKGWFYKNENNEFVPVKLSEDLIEVAQQLALWYYTNYKTNNPTNDSSFNFKDYKVDLYRGVHGIDSSNTLNWNTIDSYKYIDEYNNETNLGVWLEDQVTILTSYLIDAAEHYATSEETATGNPLKMDSSRVELIEKTVSGTDYYVVGPMKIDEVRTAVYSLNNTIFVNGNESTGAYISDANGNQESNQTISSHIGQDFYVAVPKSRVTGSDIQISFTGLYNSNEKKLLVNETVGEQPVVEVKPVKPEIELKVNASIGKKFDLALRKYITALNGNPNLITNEKTTSNLANREVSVDPSTIALNGTATYNHRKDPVVVEKGDVITYSITIYNEGEMNGHAKTIVDKLPNGLALKGYTENRTKSGTYRKGNINYSYVYDENNNTITFTNESENIISKFDGSTLNSETIEIECEVTQVPSGSTNTYLTNIAYITGAYNDETMEDVVEDRDSSTDNKPSAEQKVTGDKYPDNAYHGGNNHNGDNTKNVYNDGTNNDDYFPGREDDDDFEIVVVKPAVFDLALQKYISGVISPDGTIKQGRSEPTINTKSLANKTATDAIYTYSKDKEEEPIKVKSGDYVLYTFTVYNEGELEGYVNKITDNIPTGLQFVYVEDGTVWACDSQGTPTEIEVSSSIYQSILEHNALWKIDPGSGTETYKKDTYNGEQTVSVTCKVDEYSDNIYKLLKPYDISAEEQHNYDGTAGLDRTSVTLLLRVNGQDGTGVTIRNEAAITEAEDKDGNLQDEEDLKDRDSQTDQWKGKDGDKKYQDDEDFDNIILGKVDLALTKFITAISDDVKIEDGEYLSANKNEGSKTNPYDRATRVDTTPLRNESSTNADYDLVKDPPVPVPENSFVLYNIRVYNEGDVDVYAGEVKDYLPNYLIFEENAPTNNKYGWTLTTIGDKQVLTTNYLSKEKNPDKILNAFDKKDPESELDYEDLQVLCRISSDAPVDTELVNSSEITKYEDENGDNIDSDIDSSPNNLDETKKNQKGKPKGRYDDDEDDEDYEVVKITKKRVDLALKKFIAAISDDVKIMDGEYLSANHNEGSKENPYDRAPVVDTTPLRDGSSTTATYNPVKGELTIPAKSYVLYDIRVYNEGEVDVYAGEIKDYLPEYLTFAENAPINNKYGWIKSEDSSGKTVLTTNYLSKEKNPDKILNAFDKKDPESELDYEDLQVLCVVNDQAPSNTRLINSAEITKYEDENGNEIDKDIDSEPENLKEKNTEHNEQDDDDYETVIIKTFDLSLLKYVSEVYVTEDGKTTTTQTGNTGDNNTDIIPKVEINKKKLNSTVVKFGYTIKITNEGDIEGFAKEITDYVPQGLKFYAEDNNGWTDEGNNVISTRLLENTLLEPGESAEVKVIFRWINGSNNLGLKTNIAEISEDYNKEGVPDRDSTPDNRKEGEDDIDDAKVLLSIKTGLIHNFVMYTSVGLIILVVMGAGITAIKKYVL